MIGKTYLSELRQPDARIHGNDFPFKALDRYIPSYDQG
jgi:hypothetical protein